VKTADRTQLPLTLDRYTIMVDGLVFAFHRHGRYTLSCEGVTDRVGHPYAVSDDRVQEARQKLLRRIVRQGY